MGILALQLALMDSMLITPLILAKIVLQSANFVLISQSVHRVLLPTTFSKAHVFSLVPMDITLILPDVKPVHLPVPPAIAPQTAYPVRTITSSIMETVIHPARLLSLMRTH